MKNMLKHRSNGLYDREAIMNDLIRYIEENVSEWESQFERAIGPESFFGADLGFKSLDFIRLITAIQQQHVQAYIPFQDLFVSDNGEVLQDIQVSQLVDFLHKHLHKHKMSK
jgi:acyl carrier protein